MHLSPVLQEFDLGFQVYLKTLFYSSLNFPNHVFYIFCGCISCVNNKSAMLLRHFGSPYGISAKSGLHNQLSRKMSRGALKCAACAGILQRLFSRRLFARSAIFSAICSGSPCSRRKVTFVTTKGWFWITLVR